MSDQQNPHAANAAAIIAALTADARGGQDSRPDYLQSSALTDCQRRIYERFGNIIDTPSFRHISKTADGWLPLGDQRAEIAARVALVIERYGIGVGMMVPHGRQMRAQHVLTEIPVGDGGTRSTCCDRRR